MLALRRVLDDPNRCQDVVGHRLVFCKYAQSLSTDDLLLKCWCCDRFFAYCCSCTERERRADATRRYFPTRSPKPCHHYKIVFVDGACLGNGQGGATAGIGIAVGTNQMTMQWAIPIDDDIDPSSARTSQRAELLAAIHGICKLAEFYDSDKGDRDTKENASSNNKMTWVITSDSEYVVVGMTEWVPTWKNHGWRTPSKRKPKNLDLFQRLDAIVECYELEYHVRIAFWRIDRACNELADDLAGIAARGQTFEPVQFESLSDAYDDVE